MCIGYGLTLQQGSKLFKKLGFLGPLKSYGTNPTQHWSFLPSGEILGKFNRTIEPLPEYNNTNNNNDH
eukprot:Pgem_evm2s14451